MKKTLFLTLIILGLGLGMVHTVQAADWVIDRFESDITVTTDRTLLVTETIQTTFLVEKHGIFRDIPVSYTTGLGNSYKTKLEVLSVTNEKGEPWQYSENREGAYLRVKIGGPDVVISGPQTYVISYRVRDVLGFFEDYDELYWNVTGNQWEVPMTNVRATVRVTSLSSDSLQATCYTGEEGSTAQDCGITKETDAVRFQAQDFLTIVVGWPKGVIAAPSTIEKTSKFLKENSGYLLPFLPFALMYHQWRRKGKDPEGRHVIPVQYDAPDKLTPLELGYLVHQKFKNDYISAELVYLASKGYITIKEIKKDGFFKDSFDYELTSKKEWESDPGLRAHDKTILKGVFGSNGGTVLISSLQQKFYKTQAEIGKDLEQSMVDLYGYFPSVPSSVANKYRLAGVVLMVGGFFLPFPVSYLLGTILSGLIIILFAFIMPKRTPKGVEAWQYALGFKEYLEKAETHRVKWEEKENLFFDFLPYAMLFGVADKWAKAFEGIYQQPPEWYQGTSGTFSPMNFSHSLSSFSSYSNSAMTSTPPSRSGSSGFGGGSSGGGSGGGGGGSW